MRLASVIGSRVAPTKALPILEFVELHVEVLQLVQKMRRERRCGGQSLVDHAPQSSRPSGTASVQGAVGFANQFADLANSQCFRFLLRGLCLPGCFLDPGALGGGDGGRFFLQIAQSARLGRRMSGRQFPRGLDRGLVQVLRDHLS